MTGIGIIIAKQADLVQLKVQPGSQCAGCNACLWHNQESFIILAKDDLGSQVGEQVYYQVAPRHVVGYSLLIYLLPISLMVLGYFIGIKWLPQPHTVKEGFAVVSSMIGLGVGFLSVRWFDKLCQKSSGVIAEVIGRAAEMDYQGPLCNQQ